MAEGQRLRRRRVRLLTTGVASAVAFVALYLLAVCTPQGQALDASSLGALGVLRGEGWLEFYQGRDVVLYGLLAVAAVAAVTTATAHHPLPVICASILVGLVGLVAVAAKELLPRPFFGDFAYVDNTYPSGHAALALAAAIATIWCGPSWLSRTAVVVLGALACFVVIASLLSFAHRAADTIGGVLLAAAMSCLLVTSLRDASPAPSDARRMTLRCSLAVVGLGAAGVAISAVALETGHGSGWVDLLGVATLTAAIGGVGAVLGAHRSITPLRPDHRRGDPSRVDGL